MCPAASCVASETTSFVKDVLSLLCPDVTVHENARKTLRAIVNLFKAGKAVLLLENLSTHEAFRCVVHRDWPESSLFEAMPTGETSTLRALPDPVQSISCRSVGSRRSYCALDRNGLKIPATHAGRVATSFLNEPFQSLLATNIEVGSDWTGCLFLVDACCAARQTSCLRTLQQVVGEVGIVIYNFYLWRRASSRIRTTERERLAHDLHDGIVQSLLATELELEILMRRNVQEDMSDTSSQTLLKTQNLLQVEVRKLRQQIDELRQDRFAGMFLPRLKQLTEDFQRDTGIATKLYCDIDKDLPPTGLPAEVLHMVEEALSNVRKHSEAQTVDIRLELRENNWKIRVKDDGRGFDFSGRLSLSQLDAASKGPKVIRERVRSANGELAIESYPNQGACLDIRLAMNS